MRERVKKDRTVGVGEKDFPASIASTGQMIKPRLEIPSEEVVT